MKRFRMSTLMLLVVIAALSLALMMEHNRAKRLQVEIQTIRASWPTIISRAGVTTSPTIISRAGVTTSPPATGRDWSRP